jgi:hypothetical protein
LAGFAAGVAEATAFSPLSLVLVKTGSQQGCVGQPVGPVVEFIEQIIERFHFGLFRQAGGALGFPLLALGGVQLRDHLGGVAAAEIRSAHTLPSAL